MDHEVPNCPHCSRKMQLNTAVGTVTLKQYLCGCRGVVFHKNVVVPQKKDVNVVTFKKG